MSSIATNLGIAVSTATGIIDNLMKKDLVIRRDDNEDRRVVICSLSPHGQETINRMWALGQHQMEKLLRGLSNEQLEKAKEVAKFLLHNAQSREYLLFKNNKIKQDRSEVWTHHVHKIS